MLLDIVYWGIVPITSFNLVSLSSFSFCRLSNCEGSNLRPFDSVELISVILSERVFFSAFKLISLFLTSESLLEFIAVDPRAVRELIPINIKTEELMVGNSLVIRKSKEKKFLITRVLDQILMC